MLPRFKLHHKLALAFFAFAVVVSGLTSYILFRTATSQMNQDIRQRLLDIVSIAPGALDMERHERLIDPSHEGNADYMALHLALKAIKDNSSDIFYIYTMRLAGDGKVVFVADAETDPEHIAHLGQEYEDPSPLLLELFADPTGPVVEEETYTDEWGTWLSGYAPLRNGSGEAVAMLGVDIAADTVAAYKQRLLYLALGSFGLTLPLILFAGYLLSRTMTRPIVAMKQGADRMGQGDLDTRVAVKSRDEVGSLAESLNDMAAKLKQGRDQLAEMAEKYHSIFANAVQGIFQSTQDGKLLEVNDALVDILGHESAQDLIESVTDVRSQLYTRPEDRDVMLDILRRDGRISGFETKMRRKDGEEISVELSARTVTNKEGVDCLEGMVHDISERLKREQAEKDRQAAEAASKSKSEFLANMSHEIRTPLNAVMGLTDLALKSDSLAKHKEYLNKIKTSSKSLLSVINDILDFSKIEAGRLEIENVGFSLLEVMANVTEMFAYRAHDKDIELAVSVADNAPWALMGDPVRLGQILINLVNNAIKFTDQGEIVVSVAPAQDVSVDQEQVALRFRVKDTGIGIPQERLESIFSSFTQADGSTTRQYGGTGLGLTICRRLVGLMGGEIEARSEAGQGSEFVFTAVFGIQPHKEVRPQTPVDLRGLRVLVVDDNATSRDILAEIIASFQMEVDKARSGEQGVSKVQEAGVPYDLVLMDWKMPGMNGIEASRRIKQNKSLQQTPLICLVSAYGREDLIQQAEKAFIDAFLHKPVNQSLLFDTIMGLFGRESNLSGISSAGDEEIQATEYLRGAHFLLVEDNEINQEVAREWLESSGISVKVASNGKEALQALENETFDAVLMDVQMPEMDGYEATGHIRQQDKYKDLPIIAMTAHALKGDREKCLDAGMNDYVSKPIDPKLLFSVLSQWVKPSEQASPIQPPKAGKDADESMLLVKQLELPGIDVQEGLFRSNNNAGLYLKLLRSLHRDFSHAMEELDNALVSSDTNEAARIAHSLKGVAANVGATELSAKAAVVEVALSGQDLAREAEQIKDLGSEFQKVMLGLEQGIPEPQEQAEPGELLGRESTAEKILQIRDILDEDLETGRNMLQDILPSLRALVGGDRADAAQEYMDAFDIDGAVQALTEAYEVLGGKGGNDG